MSSIAATAASIAGVDTLKGPRIRFTASTICAGPNIQPIRSAASPWILEKVWVMTVFSVVATTDNTVVTHTFSKIHGLAALRIGWMFGPEHIIDAVNRIRGPFNVSTPAMYAAVAAIEDTAHQAMSKQFTETWRNWLTEEIGKLGLKVTPSVANFVLIHFPQEKGKTSVEADAFLTKRGLVLRALNNYGLPHSLRMTIGTEEANRLVVDGLRDFMAGK